MEAIVRMFTQSKHKEDGAPAPMPMPQAPKVEEAGAKAEEIVKQKRRAMARSRTVFTSPLGIGTQASVIKKTLLGE